MARARNIKPGFFHNELLAECSFEARLLFIGLWLLADREGRLEDRPTKIRGLLFPYEQVDIDSLLSELSSRGFLLRYERASCKCLAIPNFTKHQRPHHNESMSTLPEPICDQGSNDLLPRAQALRPDSLNPDSLNAESLIAPNGASAELSPKRRNSSAATSLAATPSEFVFPTTGKGAPEWTLPKSKLDEYLASYPGLDVLKEVRAARQWCRDNLRNRKTAGGMLKFLTGWINRAQNGNRGSFAAGQKPPRPSVNLNEIDLGE